MLLSTRLTTDNCRVPHPNVVLFDVRVGFHVGVALWDLRCIRITSGLSGRSLWETS